MPLELLVHNQPEDLLKVVNEVRLWAATAQDHDLWTGGEFAWGQPITEYTLSHPHEAYRLVLNQELVGYAELHHNNMGWVLARIAVRPDLRGRGLGHQVMQLLMNRALAHTSILRLFVSFNNVKAYSLYQLHGFVTDYELLEHNLRVMSCNVEKALNRKRPASQIQAELDRALKID